MTRSAFVLCMVVFSSCSLDRMILDGTLESTRKAATAFDTLSDLEVARVGAGASLVQVEGMQKLAPDNEDGLFLLLQSWTGFASAFVEDDWEKAVDREDDDGEAFHSNRAKEAYDRAIRFGSMLLERHHPGFVAAQKNMDTIKAYLGQFEANDAEPLLWMGAAWLSRGGVAAERPELVAELFVGVALVERSVELNDRLAYGLGIAILGSYHARSPEAELAQAKALFERALSMTQRKALSIHVMMATSYACQARDEKLYRSLLEEAVSAGDVLPEQRLENTVAQRKAKRWLGPARLKRCGFF